MDEFAAPRLTYKVDLPGGQARLREAALYVMEKCQGAERFGLTKLNKILWRADFKAYAARRLPVTGRQYQRLANGPAPVEMLPILGELQRENLIRIDKVAVGSFYESRPVPLVVASTRYFSEDDLVFLDVAIDHCWKHTGRAASKESHGVAWETRHNGDLMPYDLALLSDEELTSVELAKFLTLGREKAWRTH